MSYWNYNKVLCIGGVMAILIAILLIGFPQADTPSQNSEKDSTHRSSSLWSSAHRSERARKRQEEEEQHQLKNYQVGLETARVRAHIERVNLMEIEYSRTSFIKRWETSGVTVFLFLVKNSEARSKVSQPNKTLANNSDLHTEAQETFREKLDGILNEFSGGIAGAEYKAIWIQVFQEGKDKKKITKVTRIERHFSTYEDFVADTSNSESLPSGNQKHVDFQKGWRYSHLLDIRKMKPMPRFKFQKQLDAWDW